MEDEGEVMTANSEPDPIAVIIEAVTDAVMGELTRYVDARVDQVMEEVNRQQVEFEAAVGNAFNQTAEMLRQEIVAGLTEKERQDRIAQSYRTWVLTEAARMDVGVGEFAKIISAMKAAGKADGEG